MDTHIAKISEAWNVYMTGSPKAMLLIAALPLLFMWCDRWYGAPDRKNYAKALILLTVVVTWLAAGNAAYAVPFWWVYRSLSFKGGAGAPTNAEERRNAVARHLVVVPIMAVPTLIHSLTTMNSVSLVVLEVLTAAILFSIYAACAISLAYLNGARNNTNAFDPKLNMRIERRRGFIFGVAFASWLLVSWALPQFI